MWCRSDLNDLLGLYLLLHKTSNNFCDQNIQVYFFSLNIQFTTQNRVRKPIDLILSYIYRPLKKKKKNMVRLFQTRMFTKN